MRMSAISTTLAVTAAVAVLAAGGGLFATAQNGKAAPAPLDATVSRFLEQHRGSWRDLNVPEADGKALYDLVIECRAKRALEIGTSTGHSGIFIAWGLSKTGGKLITIDIDEGRQKEAQQHFKEAGVAPFIDARLGDAHDLVPKVDGPIDFVFIDADKEWYTNYAKSVLPKLTIGGLMTAHNVSPYGGRRQMTGDYYEWVKAQPNLQTEFRAGVLVSKKIK